MGLYTGSVRNLSRAPYRIQVLVHLLDWSLEESALTERDEAKIKRVQRFLLASDCAREIAESHGEGR